MKFFLNMLPWIFQFLQKLSQLNIWGIHHFELHVFFLESSYAILVLGCYGQNIFGQLPVFTDQLLSFQVFLRQNAFQLGNVVGEAFELYLINSVGELQKVLVEFAVHIWSAEEWMIMEGLFLSLRFLKQL